MKLKTAQFISTILNPLVLIAPIPYLLIYESMGNTKLAYFWELFSLIFILILCLFIVIGIERHTFTDFDISKRSQRPLLFTFSIGLSSIYIIFLYILHAPQILFIAVFTLVLGLISLELINKITKVSVHVATVAAFATSLFLVYKGIFFLSFLLIPIVAWARIRTHNHTSKQTIIGAFIGVLISLSVYVIFVYIV